MLKRIVHGKIPVKASVLVMGLGQIIYRQWLKGLIYLSVLISMIIFMVTYGMDNLTMLKTLGTVEADPWLGTEGDDSIMILLKGLLTVMIIIGFAIFTSMILPMINNFLNNLGVLKLFN